VKGRPADKKRYDDRTCEDENLSRSRIVVPTSKVREERHARRIKNDIKT